MPNLFVQNVGDALELSLARFCNSVRVGEVLDWLVPDLGQLMVRIFLTDPIKVVYNLGKLPKKHYLFYPFQKISSVTSLDFFVFSTLTARIFGTTGSSEI